MKGTKGSTVFPFYHSTDHVTLRRVHGKSEHFRASGDFVNEFDCVAREIHEGRTESPFVPLTATLVVMRIMDDCRRQMGLVYPFATEHSDS